MSLLHVDTPQQLTHVSLCFGYGGIDLGLHRVFGDRLRLAAVCEIEAFAVENALAKMEAGLLSPAPIWPDVRTFPWSDFHGKVDILSFGFPCQPVSCAGKRKATTDERWLFDIIADGIVHMRPGIIFAENVEGLLSAKMPDGSSVFGHCISRLEALHYRIAAGLFSASEVGAPHQRKRVFILGVADDLGERGQELCRQIAAWAEFGPARDDGGDAGGLAVAGRVQSELAARVGSAPGCAEGGGASCQSAGPDGGAWPSRPGEPQHAWEPPRVVADAFGGHGGELPRPDVRPVPARDGPEHGDDEREAQSGLGLYSHGSAARLGLSECSGLTDQELAEIRHWMVANDNRTDELRLLGNGVVPACAELAFRTLLDELLTHHTT